MTNIRPITTGPQFHWFGYYDKLQFDPTSRYVLGMAVDFEHRSPRPDDVIDIGMVDLHDDDRWIPLGESCAWGWQQGCMLQWIPGSAGEVIWNDREGDRFVAHMLNVQTGQRRTLDFPIYTLSPDGRTAIGTDFRRINHMRPGYGYAGIPDPNHDVLAPADTGIYSVDLSTGDAEHLITIEEVAAIPYRHGDLSEAKHYFNHLLFNTDGSRFIFLHRWRFGTGGFHTRMMTAAVDGSDLRVVDDYGHTSHFIWRDPRTILAWSWHPSREWAFYLYRDQAMDGSEEPEVVGEGVMTLNGHCTYLPGNEWILNDCYGGQTTGRMQELYLYHVPTGQRRELGAYHTPAGYDGEWRCDLHPRFSPDSRLVTIDSPHGGNGRQMYLVRIQE
ncbi:MAG TPA: hypothetical protein P5121_24860 [Caldilineaceae bacterium]|nr:hypothetical protein [Caldilineaceae bacterium]